MSTAADKRAAAKTYDEAVSLFDAGRYTEAAQAFLRADELLPSVEALESAIASARRVHDHLLVATAAQRAIQREHDAPKFAAEARMALAEAESHLVRLELSCTPTPCALSIDGKVAASGAHHVLPGTHTLRASAGAIAVAEERVDLAAGSAHRVELTPEPAEPRARMAPQHPPPANRAVARAKSAPARDERSAKPLEPWTFYVGAGVAAGLVVATVWSGTDAIDAANSYRNSSTRTQEDRDAAYAAVRRTDYLLLGSLVAAGLTTYAGLSLVEWNAGKSALRASPMLDNTGVLISGELW